MKMTGYLDCCLRLDKFAFRHRRSRRYPARWLSPSPQIVPGMVQSMYLLVATTFEPARLVGPAENNAGFNRL
jgi:hypothetical protein